MRANRNTTRIIEVLDLLNNEQRPSTISSYITYIISSLKKASLSEIIEFTQIEFELGLEASEVSEAAILLVRDGQLVLIGEKYSLTESAKANMAARVDASNEQEGKLKENFYKNLTLLSDIDLTPNELNRVFNEFKGYIHENFFYYGKAAIAMLGSNSGEANSLTTKQVFKLYSDKLPSKLRKFFYAYIENLAANSTILELEYYESLADRAEQFFALGLSKELAQELASSHKIDWTVFVDTNFLLSVLKIRANTMNPAVDSLLRIIEENKDYFTIKLSYLKTTYKELIQFKPVLNKIVLNQRLTNNQIKSALQSDELDVFTEAYYQKQLVHGQATQHPSAILDQAINILNSKSIIIYNSEVKGINLESSEFIDSISDYSKYHSLMNEARLEKNVDNELVYKNVYQLEHDVYLREAILTFRDKNEVGVTTHFQDCKVFGLTLDMGLIAYDKHAGRRKNGNELFTPCFFTPAYLLKKLYKLLPVQTEDYRKSFLSSIASPVFSGSEARSEVSQTALAIFHALGIDDMTFMTKSLTSKIFLDEIKNIGGDVERTTSFIESELSRELKLKQQEESRLAKELELKQESLKEANEARNSALRDNSNLTDKHFLLEERVETLNKGLKATKKAQGKQLQAIIRANSTALPLLPFSNEQDKLEIERLKSSLREKEEAEKALLKQNADAEAKAAKDKRDTDREEYIRIIVEKWKRKSVYNLLIPLLILFICVSYLLYLNSWSVTGLILRVTDLNKNPTLAFILSSVLTLFVFLYNAFVVKIYYDRHFNNSNIKAFKEMQSYPAHLK